VSATFDLTLDSHAPQITWGDPTGTEAGDELHVPYTIDEPTVVSASVRLADSRELPMVVTGTELVVTLPADAPNGNTVVSALVRDDVLNEATRTLTFAIGGVVTPPAPPAPTGGMPQEPPRGPNRRLVRIRSVAEASSRVKIRATHDRIHSTVDARSAIRVERRPAPPVPPPRPDPRRPPNHHRFRQRSVGVVATRHRIQSHDSRIRSVAEARTTITVRKRDDELPLLVLDLI
jgi:hypothetical protein